MEGFRKNAVHWHLVLNHIPILATAFGLCIVAYAWWLRSTDVTRVGLALLIVAGIAIVPVYYTGHDAEEIAEELSGVKEAQIEHHEEAAETSYYLLIVLGLMTLCAFIQTFRVEEIPSWMYVLIVLVAIISLGSVIKTTNDGGKIRHPEITMSGDVEH